MDYILGVFPQLGYVVKKVSKRLYKLVKFKKRQPLKAVLFSFTSMLKGRQQRLIKKLPFIPNVPIDVFFLPSHFKSLLNMFWHGDSELALYSKAKWSKFALS